jgi:hypothetical protein
MVKKRSNKIGLVVYHSDLNEYSFLVEVLSTTLGYHPTQAQVCANQILLNGEYLVRSFHVKDYQRARALYEVLIKNEIPTELLPM